jgi:hypothetical protein
LLVLMKLLVLMRLLALMQKAKTNHERI